MEEDIIVSYQVLDSGIVHSAGTPVIIYGINVDEADCNTEVFSGSEAGIGGTGPIYFSNTKAGDNVFYPNGIFFPNGAFVDTSATTTVVFYKKL
jgi:hypothetical protein